MGEPTGREPVLAMAVRRPTLPPTCMPATPRRIEMGRRRALGRLDGPLQESGHQPGGGHRRRRSSHCRPTARQGRAVAGGHQWPQRAVDRGLRGRRPEGRPLRGKETRCLSALSPADGPTEWPR